MSRFLVHGGALTPPLRSSPGDLFRPRTPLCVGRGGGPIGRGVKMTSFPLCIPRRDQLIWFFIGQLGTVGRPYNISPSRLRACFALAETVPFLASKGLGTLSPLARRSLIKAVVLTGWRDSLEIEEAQLFSCGVRRDGLEIEEAQLFSRLSFQTLKRDGYCAPFPHVLWVIVVGVAPVCTS